MSLITAALAVLKEPLTCFTSGGKWPCSFFSYHLCKLLCCCSCLFPSLLAPVPKTELSKRTPGPPLASDCTDPLLRAHHPDATDLLPPCLPLSRLLCLPLAFLLYYRIWVQCPGGVGEACRCYSHFRGEAILILINKLASESARAQVSQFTTFITKSFWVKKVISQQIWSHFLS